MAAPKKLPDTTSTIHLDLDAAQRPENEVREPFAFSTQGRRMEMADPQDMDWRQVVLLENPVQLFRICLNEEDRKFFFEQEMPGWKLTQLVEGFNSHYGLEEQLRKARQQQQLASL